MASPFTPDTIPSSGDSFPSSLTVTETDFTFRPASAAVGTFYDVRASGGGQAIEIAEQAAGALGQITLDPGTADLLLGDGSVGTCYIDFTTVSVGSNASGTEVDLRAERIEFQGTFVKWTNADAAPADNLFAAGDFALWLDKTDGVGNTKLMVKAKSADGTVKTATIVLA